MGKSWNGKFYWLVRCSITLHARPGVYNKIVLIVERFCLHLELFSFAVDIALGSIKSHTQGSHLSFIKFRLSREWHLIFHLRGDQRPMKGAPEARQPRRKSFVTVFFTFNEIFSHVALLRQEKGLQRGWKMFIIVHTTTTWHGATNCHWKKSFLLWASRQRQLIGEKRTKGNFLTLAIVERDSVH